MADLEDLSIAPDQVCFLVVKARQLNAKDVVTEPDPASNPTDDGAAAVLEDHEGDPTRGEIFGFIQALNVDERLDLATLVYLGRDNSSVEDWAALRLETAQAIGANLAKELLEIPLLADYLEEALSKFGASCSEFEADRL